MNTQENLTKKKNRDLLKQICREKITEAVDFGRTRSNAKTFLDLEIIADIADELKDELAKKFNIQI